MKSKKRRVVCTNCKSRMPPKLRSRMPITHAIETISGTMINRLDSALDDITEAAVDVMGDYIPTRAEAEKLAVKWVQIVQARLFPEEFGTGPAYTPDPNGRMDVPPNPLGLVPRLPTVSIYARHLLEKGKQSPAAGMTTPDGKAMFSDAELVRLAERQEKRSAR